MKRLLLFLALTLSGSLCAADLRAPEVPKNWKIELLAQAPDIRHPSVVCSAPDGRIFVAEDPMDISAPADAKQGRVICFHPDGRRTVYATNLHAVFGMQYLEGHLYLLHNPKFSSFRDLGNHGTHAFDLIDSTNPNPWALDWNDHIPANFKLSMDGYFYLAVGDKGLFNAKGRDGRMVNLHGGGIARIRPDGSGLEIFSTGVRNILDVALNSEDEIFTYDNTDEHNWMGRLTHMVDGGFYGYPHDFVPRRAYTLWMMHDFGAGAACGTLAYTEDALPAEYHDDLFLSDFGKRQVTRVKVERDGATYRVVRHEDFFTNQPDDFRPVGIAWSTDGLSLLVCDWQHRDVKENVTVGRVWKVSYTGKSQAQPKAAWYAEAARGGTNTFPSSQELIAGLSHRSREVRMTAQRTLARQQPSLASLEKLALETKAAVLPRTHALWALHTLDAAKAATTSKALINDSDPMLRRQALRQLGNHSSASSTDIFDRLHDTNVSVRFHAATTVGRLADTNAIVALLNRLDERDLFTRYAIFTALNRIGRSHPSAWPSITSGLTNDNSLIAEGSEFALRETYDESLLKALITLTGSSTATQSARERALRLIAALHHQSTPWKGEWWAYHPALSPAPRRTVAWNGTPQVIEQLRQSLESSDDARQKLIAVEGLRDADDTHSAPALQQAFRNERDESLLRSIIRTFATWRHQESGVFLAEVLGNGKLSSDALKEESIRAIATIAHPGAERVLLNESARTNLPVSIRLALIDGLGALRSTNAVAFLRSHLDDPTSRSNVVRSLSRIGGAEAQKILQSLLSSAEVQTQLLAISSLGELGDARAIDSLLHAWKNPATRWAAIEALARIKDMRALDAYLDGLSSPNPALREQVRKALGTMRDAALKSIEQKNHLPPQVLAELRMVFAGHAAVENSPLFKSAAKGLDLQDYRAFAITNTGNARHGQVIFFDEAGVACLKCHAVGAHGGNVGPDLTTIGKQFPRSDLIDHLLHPSKAVREGYQQYLIETRDGESYSGAIRGEDAETVTLIDASAKLRAIPKRDIVSRKASELSLMPEGLHAGLSLEQFSDLIAFMESRQADPRLAQPRSAPAGFTALFNGRDLSDWKAVAGWTATNNLLLHLGHGDHLWTQREFEDFTLKLEWRWPDAPKIVEFPVIDRDGHDVFLAPGKPKMERVLDAGDSGVFLRGFPKAQANLFCYPIGSGESWEYRTDPKMTAEQRRAVTPRLQADRPIGDWNEMEITLRGNRMSVRLNGHDVMTNAELPGLPPRGPIGLQHEHGRIEFRNLFILRGGTN